MERFRSSLLCFLVFGTVACGSSDATAPGPGPVPLPALQPLCARPAQLLGVPDPAAPGYIVVFHAGVDAETETARLAAAYDFQPRHVYTAALEGFSAELTREVVAELRCVSTIDYVEHNQVFAIGS